MEIGRVTRYLSLRNLFGDAPSFAQEVSGVLLERRSVFSGYLITVPGSVRGIDVNAAWAMSLKRRLG